MKKNNQKKQSNSPKLEFTGERFIPALNKGAAFFYEHLIRYLFASQFTKNKVVLDAGSGAGYGSHILSKYGQAKKVFGIDTSSEAINYAKNKYGFKNISFKINDIEKLEIISDASIQVGVSFEVIEHIRNQTQFLEQIVRVLKTNGIFIVSTPNKYTYPPGNEFHIKELYPEEFYKLLKKYFKNVKFYHQGFELAQIIREERKEEIKVEEEFCINNQKLYSPVINGKNSQYLIAICSNRKIPKMEAVSMSLEKADGFDFSQGLLSLRNQFAEIQSMLSQEVEKNKVAQRQIDSISSQKKIAELEKEIAELEYRRNLLFQSTWFRLWRICNKIIEKL